MLFKIAWRNIWRNKVRSAVLIAAIAMGLWAGVFATAFVQGMMNQKMDAVVKKEISHFQIHRPGFRDDQLPELFMSEGTALKADIQQDQRAKGVAGRVITMGMMATANKSGYIKVSGIDPSEEAKVSGLNNNVIEGSYFEDGKSKSIYISQEMAEDFKIGLRSKVVLTFQDVNNDITAAAFRVVGIYKTNNNMYDKSNAFVLRETLSPLLGVDKGLHEIAVLLNDHDAAEQVSNEYAEANPNLEVVAWLDLVSGMRFMVDAFDTYLYIIVGIILLALLLSILNTMLMAVLERVREIGMLMAVGMSKLRVFGMIMLETVFIGMIGGVVGLLIAWGFVSYFQANGIHLAGAAYGEMGFSNLIYPQLETQKYFEVSLMVFAMAMLAAILPARKALQLIPVEAIRKI